MENVSLDYITRLDHKNRIIANYMGVILIVIGSILLLSSFTTFMFGEDYLFFDFALPAALTILSGIVLFSAFKIPKGITIKASEGGIIVVLSWVCAILVSCAPFMLSGMLTFPQAVFETTSGWTTTGLSVVDVTKSPKSILLFRSLMQYFGGSGLAVATMAMLLGPHAAALYGAEARSDKLLPNIKKSVRLIMLLYTGYTVLGIILYVLAGMNLFEAVNHSIASISTGGFSTRAMSIGEYNSVLIEFITIILMLIGTVNFAAHYILLKGDYKTFFKIDEIRFMGKLLGIFVPAAGLSLYFLYGNAEKAVRTSVFDFVSALSTTGFSTVSYTDWSDFTVTLMIIIMIIGGGTGSTAGGLKLHRANLIIKAVSMNIRNRIMPKHYVKSDSIVRPEGTVEIKSSYLKDTLTFGYLYIIFLIFGAFCLMAYGYSIKESFFEIASCLSTVGLSIGVTSASLPPFLLIVMSLEMLLGRLEFLVVIVTVLKAADGFIKTYVKK